MTTPTSERGSSISVGCVTSKSLQQSSMQESVVTLTWKVQRHTREQSGGKIKSKIFTDTSREHYGSRKSNHVNESSFSSSSFRSTFVEPTETSVTVRSDK